MREAKRMKQISIYFAEDHKAVLQQVNEQLLNFQLPMQGTKCTCYMWCIIASDELQHETTGGIQI